MSHRFCRNGLAAALFTASLLVGSSLPAQAQRYYQRHYRCEQRIRRAEANLERAIQRHGEHSRQAERRRRQLEEIRARCRGQL
jgi:predicted ribosome quality control (RQC) complex YloA/Tae2 family protein